MTPLLTVIVPVYNVERYLNRCIDSIINQEYKNLQIILINDGSKDSSGDICDDYAKKDDRIFVFHQKNKGQSSARNLGLDNATGDFVAFIDSDDWIDSAMFTTMLNYSAKNNLEIIECDHQSTLDPKIERTPHFVVENRQTATLRIIENQFFSVCRRIYKRSTIADLRFKENYIYEDMIFTTELLGRIVNIGYINIPFYTYFIENDSSTMHGTYNERNVKSIDVILNFKKNISDNFNNKIIDKASRHYILFFLLDHYKKLFNNNHLDPQFIHRKKIHSLIIENYTTIDNHNKYIKLARYSPVWCFGIFCLILRLLKK